MRVPSLAQLTLAYLALPQFIFLLSWLRPGIGIVVAGILLGGLGLAVRTLGGENAAAPSDGSLGWGVILAAVVVGIVMTFVSGASGVLHQTWDWEKHNAVLLDLTRYRWPVIYELPGPDRYHLLYYLAYYLPSAVAAKLGGAGAGQAVLAGWTAIGTILALLWFAQLVRLRPVLSILLFPLLSGMDIIGYWILHGGFPLWFQNVEGWLRDYVYSSNLVLHVWGPQHALATWLGVPLVLYCAANPRWLGVAALGCGLLFFWASFVFVGVAAVLGWAALAHRIRIREVLAHARAFGFAGPLIATVVLVAANWVYLSNGSSRIPFSWLWEEVNLREFAPRLLLFYIVEFGLFLLLLPRKAALDPRERSLLVLALGLLLAAPWVHFGLFNDLTVRVAHVGQYALWAVLVGGIWKSPGTSGLRRAWPLWACLLLGAVTPFLQVRFILRATALNPHPVRPETHLPHLQPIAIAAQYLGRLDSWKAGILDLAGAGIAVLPAQPGSAPFAFRSPMLLFNFRGQGVEQDASGWWMWNRTLLELAFRAQDDAVVGERRPVRVRFELAAFDRERAVTLTLRGSAVPVERTFTARPGEWSPVDLGDITLAKPELTFVFASPDPISGDANDPHRREFGVKNVRFELGEVQGR